jgi:translation elongation factor EF-1beta
MEFKDSHLLSELYREYSKEVNGIETYLRREHVYNFDPYYVKTGGIVYREWYPEMEYICYIKLINSLTNNMDDYYIRPTDYEKNWSQILKLLNNINTKKVTKKRKADEDINTVFKRLKIKEIIDDDYNEKKELYKEIKHTLKRFRDPYDSIDTNETPNKKKQKIKA